MSVGLDEIWLMNKCNYMVNSLSDNTPLVSVPVITYNSSKTIVETLDSIYNQIYPNIELIVSDDASTDDTVEVVRDWVNVHKERFVRTEIITVGQNTGTTENYERASKACKGEWVKDFDGDDILLPEASQTYVDYIKEHPNSTYVFAKVACFGGNEKRRKFMTDFFNYDFFSWSNEEQYDYLTLERNCIPSPTNFYNRKNIEQLGIKYDKRIPLIEDWPRWINVVKSGVRIQFIDKVLALYRMSDNSLSTREVQTDVYNKSYALVYKYYGFLNDYKKNNKKEVLYKYLRNEKLLHDNVLFWAVLCKLYKLLILRR